MWSFPGHQGDQVIYGHHDELFAWVGGAASFGDDDACWCVVVAGCDVGFFDPRAGLESAAVVFAFHGYFVAEVP
jgi:hypothetical protein